MEQRKDIYGKTINVIADITPNERQFGPRWDRIADAIEGYLGAGFDRATVEDIAKQVEYRLTRCHTPRDTMVITQELIDPYINDFRKAA